MFILFFTDKLICLRDRKSGGYWFCPVCHSVILSETLTLLVTFEQGLLQLWYFTWVFPCDKTFPCVPLFVALWPWSLTHFRKNNLANNFWTVIARALMFYMSITCDTTFPWVPLFFTLWPWPWSFTHFWKTLTLLITFVQWVLELWNFTRVFLVIRPFCGYHYFWHCVTLTLEFDLFFEIFNLPHKFLTVRARAFMFHMSIPSDKTFPRVPLLLTLWPWPWSLTLFLKTLTFLITFERWELEFWYFTWVFLDLGVWPIFENV